MGLPQGIAITQWIAPIISGALIKQTLFCLGKSKERSMGPTQCRCYQHPASPILGQQQASV